MKIHILLSLSFVLITISGCSKENDTSADENHNKFPVPHWQADTSGLLAYSMTTVIAISDSLHQTVSANDKVAAFIGEECRGVGVYIVRGNAAPVFYIMIKGNADESAQIKLKYYNSQSSYMYITGDFINFEVDYNYGTADLPAKPSFTPM
ncbi:MAG: hypothetical protein ABI325_11710 [Ginsengibacter sp.]